MAPEIIRSLCLVAASWLVCTTGHGGDAPQVEVMVFELPAAAAAALENEGGSVETAQLAGKAIRSGGTLVAAARGALPSAGEAAVRLDGGGGWAVVLEPATITAARDAPSGSGPELSVLVPARTPVHAINSTGGKGYLLLVHRLGVPTSVHPLDRIDPSVLYEERPATRDGIGKTYFGREIALVMGHLAAGWLERSNREQEERTDVLLEALPLRPTSVVADIGAGTGYFSFPIARRVPEGRVIAVDIQPQMLDIVRTRARSEKVLNIEPSLGRVNDVGLAPASVDLILLVDAYHEFDHPWEMTRSMHRALRHDGRIVLVEYRGEDVRVPIKPLHKMTASQARREWEAAGFELEHVDDPLPWQHIIIFRKRPLGIDAPPPNDEAAPPASQPDG